MRNLRLRLEYDGTAYGGWQVQPNAPSVQAAVESALATLTGEPVRVTAAGRTDAGVHALGQMANFRTGTRVPLRGFLHGLNALLPADIAVRQVDRMPDTFDCRRSAAGKTYRYRLHVAPAPSAFARRTSWRVRGRLDLGALRAGARHLVGTHDFGSFQAAGCAARTTVRTVTAVDVDARGEFVEITVEGTAFLRYMVRILVGTLVEAALGRRDPDGIPDLLARPDRTRAGPTAPPQGLFLVAVRYDVQPLESCP